MYVQVSSLQDIPFNKPTEIDFSALWKNWTNCFKIHYKKYSRFKRTIARGTWGIRNSYINLTLLPEDDIKFEEAKNNTDLIADETESIEGKSLHHILEQSGVVFIPQVFKGIMLSGQLFKLDNEQEKTFLRVDKMLGGSQKASKKKIDEHIATACDVRKTLLKQSENIEEIKRNEGKNTLELKDIFNRLSNPTKLVKKVWISGAPGSGKTTLCLRMLSDWACASVKTPFVLPNSIKPFQWIAWIKLRKLAYFINCLQENGAFPVNKDTGECLANECVALFLINQLPEAFQKSPAFNKITIAELLHRYRNKILYLADGYDEVATLPKEHPTQAILKKFLLKQPNVLVTSRPYYEIPLVYKPKFRKIELVGLDLQASIKYIKKHFKKTPAKYSIQKKLIKLIRDNLNFRSIAHIPINLEIICFLAGTDTDNFFEQSGDITVSYLYKSMTYHLLRRFYLEVPRLAGCVIDEELIKEEVVQSGLLNCLGKLALQGLLNRSLIFTSSEMHQCIRLTTSSAPHAHNPEREVQLRELIFSTGMLNGISWDRENRTLNGSGEFAHLTFQEYWAAWYLTEELQQHEIALYIEGLIKEHKFNGVLQVVWPFVANLLADSDDIEVLERFAELLDQPPNDLAGLAYCGLILRCINAMPLDKLPRRWELQLVAIIDGFNKSCRKELFISAHKNERFMRNFGSVTEGHNFFELKFMLNSIMINQHLQNCSRILQQWVVPVIKKELNSSKEIKRHTALNKIRLLGATVIQPDFINTIEVLLKHGSPDIQITASQLVLSLGSGIVGSKLLEVSKEIAQKSNIYIDFAYDAHENITIDKLYRFLCRISQKDKFADIISTFCKKLKEYNDVVQKSFFRDDDLNRFIITSEFVGVNRLQLLTSYGEKVGEPIVFADKVFFLIRKMLNNWRDRIDLPAPPFLLKDISLNDNPPPVFMGAKTSAQTIHGFFTHIGKKKMIIKNKTPINDKNDNKIDSVLIMYFIKDLGINYDNNNKQEKEKVDIIINFLKRLSDTGDDIRGVISQTPDHNIPQESGIVAQANLSLTLMNVNILVGRSQKDIDSFKEALHEILKRSNKIESSDSPSSPQWYNEEQAFLTELPYHYADEMRKPRTFWGGDIELKSIGLLKDVAIVIVTQYETYRVGKLRTNEDEPNPRVITLHYDGSHYALKDHPINGDGDCLFNACIQAIKKLENPDYTLGQSSEDEILHLRNEVADYIRDHEIESVRARYACILNAASRQEYEAALAQLHRAPFVEETETLLKAKNPAFLYENASTYHR